jgi:hypothetical protein
MEVSGQFHAPATLSPVPFGLEAGWAPESVWTLKKNSVAFSPQANYTDSDRRLSEKLMPTFADRGCRVVSATDPPAVNSVFLTGAATFSFK